MSRHRDIRDMDLGGKFRSMGKPVLMLIDIQRSVRQRTIITNMVAMRLFLRRMRVSFVLEIRGVRS